MDPKMPYPFLGSISLTLFSVLGTISGRLPLNQASFPAREFWNFRIAVTFHGGLDIYTH